VKKILEDVERETNELDLFRRMWVNRTFRKRCGMSIRDWLNTISELVSELEEYKKSKKAENTEKINHLYGKFLWLKNNLEKLANYFRENMKDAEGYFKNSEELSKALKVLAYRENTVLSLIDLLKQSGESFGIS